VITLLYGAGARNVKADEITYTAVLNGANVRPVPFNTQATGFATMTLNDECGCGSGAMDQFVITVGWQNLMGYTQSIDIHYGSSTDVGPRIFL
jgi:hypothetical protein